MNNFLMPLTDYVIYSHHNRMRLNNSNKTRDLWEHIQPWRKPGSWRPTWGVDVPAGVTEKQRLARNRKARALYDEVNPLFDNDMIVPYRANPEWSGVPGA